MMEANDTIAAIPKATVDHLINQVEKVIRGKRPQIELVVTCLLAGGHILMEDNPGTGKTVLARTLAQCISGDREGQHVALQAHTVHPRPAPYGPDWHAYI